MGHLRKVGVLGAFHNIYVPNVEKDRRDLWEELLSWKAQVQIPWCMGSDFNLVKVETEMEQILTVGMLNSLINLFRGVLSWSST